MAENVSAWSTKMAGRGRGLLRRLFCLLFAEVRDCMSRMREAGTRFDAHLARSVLAQGQAVGVFVALVEDLFCSAVGSPVVLHAQG